jgi:hypothetical protein
VGEPLLNELLTVFFLKEYQPKNPPERCKSSRLGGGSLTDRIRRDRSRNRPQYRDRAVTTQCESM